MKCSDLPSSIAPKVAVLVLALLTILSVFLPILMPLPPMDMSLPYSSPTEGSRGEGRLQEWDLNLKTVALTVEDAVKFQLDTVEGAEQWKAIIPSNGGYATVRQGANERRYRVAMFHALDCLNNVREGVLQRKADRGTPVSPEAHFCLDYLRQMIQCRSNIQLEQVRSEYGPKSVQPFATHSNCRDWTKVYKEIDSELECSST